MDKSLNKIVAINPAKNATNSDNINSLFSVIYNFFICIKHKRCCGKIVAKKKEKGLDFFTLCYMKKIQSKPKEKIKNMRLFLWGIALGIPIIETPTNALFAAVLRYHI